jgi:hypothetical protein
MLKMRMKRLRKSVRNGRKKVNEMNSEKFRRVKLPNLGRMRSGEK